MENKTFTFHLHLPGGFEKIGQPIILGEGKEWENPIIKLRQPVPENPTYWQSEPITISLSTNDIKYKFAIYIPKKEKYIFEGNDNCILDTERENQFVTWKNDHALVDDIYDSIKSNNLKDKAIEYQDLLTLHNDLIIRSSNLSFITNRINNKLKEKQLFLCLLLGYYIPRQGAFYELPNQFPSELLLNALEAYKHESLPSDNKDQMYTAITTLVQNNAFQMKFDWFVIFTIAAEVDPNYTFLDRLRALKYPNEDLLEEFIKQVKNIRPYIEGVEFETYVKLAKWLIQLCTNINSLLKLWGDILVHNDVLDRRIYGYFIERVRENISYDDAVTLEYQFKRLPKDYRDDLSDVFRDCALYFLESASSNWTNENITAIKNLLHNESLNWDGGKIIQSLDLISQSHTLELLNIFPELLDDWFRSDFSDKEKKIPKICTTWFKNLLDANNRNSSNESNFVFSVFMQLECMYPLLGHRKNIWQDLTTIAMEGVRACSESRIFGATKLLNQIKEREVRILFLEMVKEILNKSSQQTNDQLINKIFLICDCKSKNLEVPNSSTDRNTTMNKIKENSEVIVTGADDDLHNSGLVPCNEIQLVNYEEKGYTVEDKLNS